MRVAHPMMRRPDSSKTNTPCEAYIEAGFTDDEVKPGRCGPPRRGRSQPSRTVSILAAERAAEVIERKGWPPEGALLTLRLSPTEFANQMRVAAALLWYSQGEISQSVGADIAGISRAEFIEELSRRRISVVQVAL